MMRITLFYILFIQSFCICSQTPLDRLRERLEGLDYNSCFQILDSCLLKNYQRDSSLFYAGLVSIKEGRREKCKDYCYKLSKEYPEFKEVHYLKGLLYFHDQNYGKSADEFTKALKENPKDIKALFDRSVALGMIEDYSDAIEDLTNCIKLDPKFTKAYYSRAYWYEYTSNHNAAIKDYESAISLNPKYYDAYFGLAYIYQLQKLPAKACETINVAIQEGSQIAEELKDSFCR